MGLFDNTFHMTIHRIMRLAALWCAVAAAPAALAQDELFDEPGALEADSAAAMGASHAADSLQASLPWPARMRARLDRLVDSPLFTTSQLGMMVYDLTADSAIYCHNERQLMRPASTLKALTAITAIDRLGGSYRFSTELRYNGTVADRTLTGNLYCVGGFDPLFNIDDMRAFVESVRRMGVDTIRGRIVADKSMKDTCSLGKGWCWDDDNPVLSPLLISRRDRFASRFAEELRDAGVTVDAELAEGETPAGAFMICNRFHTIDQVLMRMMKASDNLFAEALLYQLAAASGHRPASADMACAAVRRQIRQLVPRAAGCRIVDGSGLSLYNYVSAEQEVMMLRYASLNTNIFLHLYPSLPVAGEDGTLRNRMRGSFASGNVHAKTGTLTAVSSLAGYLTAANGHRICFAIINQGLTSDRQGRAFQDRVCNALCAP